MNAPGWQLWAWVASAFVCSAAALWVNPCRGVFREVVRLLGRQTWLLWVGPNLTCSWEAEARCLQAAVFGLVTPLAAFPCCNVHASLRPMTIPQSNIHRRRWPPRGMGRQRGSDAKQELLVVEAEDACG